MAVDERIGDNYRIELGFVLGLTNGLGLPDLHSFGEWSIKGGESFELLLRIIKGITILLSKFLGYEDIFVRGFVEFV
jgi:hypothetical protein